MKRVIFEFENDDIAQNFLAYMCDGGGECGALDTEMGITRFDYSQAFAKNKNIADDYIVKVI